MFLKEYSASFRRKSLFLCLKNIKQLERYSYSNKYRSKWVESFKTYTTAVTVPRNKVITSRWFADEIVGIKRTLSRNRFWDLLADHFKLEIASNDSVKASLYGNDDY